MTKGFAGALVQVWAACALLVAAPEAGPRGKEAKAGDRTQAALRSSDGVVDEEGAIPIPVAEEMTKYAAPGPRHRELEAFAGSWTTRTRVRESPDARPLEFPGSAEYRMILGGRFLQLESRMFVNGVENHGLGIVGYDALKERYSYYYIHDGETQALVGLGDRDSTGAAINFEVAMDMTVSGERAKPIRAVLRRISTGRHVFEMFENYLDGREWKVLEIAYDRAR